MQLVGPEDGQGVLQQLAVSRQTAHHAGVINLSRHGQCNSSQADRKVAA